MNNTIKQILMNATVVAFTACGGGGTTPEDTGTQSSGGSTTSGDSNASGATTTGVENNTTEEIVFSVTHNGTIYGIVSSPYTGKIWLDRNLGAARVCTSFNDTACYGDYYQWGRDFDGHQDLTSDITTTQVTDINNAGSEFVINTFNYGGDWAQAVDYRGAVRSTNWSKTDGSSICPTEFRVPTLQELKAEIVRGALFGRETLFQEFLKIPSAGIRLEYDGVMHNVGLGIAFWSTTIGVGGTLAFSVGVGASPASAEPRAYGRSIRCIKD